MSFPQPGQRKYSRIMTLKSFDISSIGAENNAVLPFLKLLESFTDNKDQILSLTVVIMLLSNISLKTFRCN